MGRWSRQTALDGSPFDGRERWTLERDGEPATAFDVTVRVGKPLDVLALKGTSLDEIRGYARVLTRRAQALYRSGSRTDVVAQCPACAAGGSSSVPGVVVNGIAYRRCADCGHAYVGVQPAGALHEEDIASSDEVAGVYTDEASISTRLAQVVRPKLEWVVETYHRVSGRAPRTVLDVGAGGGHFVEGCRRAGLQAQGYELSQASRSFATRTFGLDLLADDFLSDAATSRFDVVTFWGLLEYVTAPADFTRRAAERLGDGGLLVVEVPRYDCLGTAAQSAPGAVISRHLDPTSHLQCFSDASLATLLVRTGFAPRAAWYFGMDAYEVLVQSALTAGEPALVERMAQSIPVLQAALDRARACDDLVVAAARGRV